MAQLRTFNVGIKGVIVVDDKVLLLKRENRWSGVFWEVPAGQIEGGAGFEETLQRELREEVQSIGQVEIGQLLHAARVPHRAGDIGLVLPFYRVQADLPEVVLSNEHIGYAWVGAEDLPALQRSEDGVATFDYTRTAARIALGNRPAPG